MLQRAPASAEGGAKPSRSQKGARAYLLLGWIVSESKLLKNRSKTKKEKMSLDRKSHQKNKQLEAKADEGDGSREKARLCYSHLQPKKGYVVAERDG